ncbi:hypothetical protein EI990_02900 [Streptococcus suis]|nr:hypothetical protein EI988_02610 [Streptococcus suis]RRR39209.1 hypothetical protein EI984_01970 [Streptococcus suis]RRR54576.1 hypothetical protein EI990_02900 [Streptococcus suis]RRR60730.1 hypothetical protein EI986_01420 [Streptococcus suis]
MGKNSTGQKEFVNKSLFLVVELKRSIPRPFYSLWRGLANMTSFCSFHFSLLYYANSIIV